AHLWSYAEHYGLTEIFTEDLQHDRLYGTVRVVNPFIELESPLVPYTAFLLELPFQILEPIDHNVDLRRRVQSRGLDHQEALSINTDVEGTVRDAGHAISPVHTLKEFGPFASYKTHASIDRHRHHFVAGTVEQLVPIMRPDR